MNILKIFKNLDELENMKSSLINGFSENSTLFTELEDGSIKVNSDQIFFCTPCFVDAEKMYNKELDRIEILIPSDEINEFDGKWIAEITGNHEKLYDHLEFKQQE